MIEIGGWLHLELTDLIRMNQLVRGRIDLEGFVNWYETLSAEEQAVLLCHLHLFAQQAGGNEQTFRAAVATAQWAEDDPRLPALVSFLGGWSRECRLTLVEWLPRLNAKERRALLPLFVQFFGLAEGAVFARETAENCNHWWHRDLLDPLVVQDLLNDPNFFRTSMKDDAALKEAVTPPP